MSFSSSATPAFSVKKFESQDEVEEKRKKRQEEWEKVRKPDDPEECPEEPVDNRCLYDKLEEQKLKKQEEWEEKTAFRNQVRRLDADETDFLDFCTEREQEIRDERKQEEHDILIEMRKSRVVKIEEGSKQEQKKRPLQSQTSKKSQMSLLAGAVKRKKSEDVSPPKKPKGDQTVDEQENVHTKGDDSVPSAKPCVAKVVAVLPVALPGLSSYADSSDSLSSDSSDSDTEFNLASRHQAVVIRQQEIHQ